MEPFQTNLIFTQNRYRKIYEELAMAVSRTESTAIKDWGKRSAINLPVIATRRLKNLGGLMVSIARFTSKEVRDAVHAKKVGRLGFHAGGRCADAVSNTLEFGRRVKNTATAMGKLLLNDPKKNAPTIFALALGFLAGSGGIDGNGGIPDSDFAMGIGWHRSPLTHTIIAGIIVEGAIIALADLTDVIYENLPSDHDPFWDSLIASKSEIALRLTQGVSSGIAFHLGVDATLQPGAYHNLPVELPIEVHQAILGLNALAEGLDVSHKDMKPLKMVQSTDQSHMDTEIVRIRE